MKADRRKHRAKHGAATLLGRVNACALAFLLVFLLAWVPFGATVEASTSPGPASVTVQIAAKPADKRQRCPKKTAPGQPSACAAPAVPLAFPESRGAAFDPTLQRSTAAPLDQTLQAAQCCGT